MNMIMKNTITLVALLFCGAAFATTGLDDLLNTGAQGVQTAAGGGSEAAALLGDSIGRLTESLMIIFGLYYALKGVLIYARISSGKQMGQGDNMGGMFSHLVAGILAYHSRAFFSVVHNTIPMLPDFGRLVYDAELMRSLI